MLKAITLFFRKEPQYFWGLCAVLLFHGYFLFGAGPSGKGVVKKVTAISAFQTAEKKWNKTLERREAYRDFAKEKPSLALLFQILTAFFFFAFFVGLIVDAFFIWSKSFRRDFTGTLSPPLNQAWSFSILFKAVILLMLWGIVLSFAIAVFQIFFPKLASDNFYMVLHTILMHVITLYYMIKFIAQQGCRWPELGIRLPAGREILCEIKAGVIGYFGVMPLFAFVAVILLTVSSFIRYEPPPHPLMNVFLEEKHIPFLFVMSLLLGTVIGPVFEEIFFRGFCYPILRNRWGKFWAVVLSAAFFAGIHHSGFVFWPIFVLGVALAYLYEKRRSLIASITLHVMHNTFFIAYFFLIKQILGDRGV